MFCCLGRSSPRADDDIELQNAWNLAPVTVDGGDLPQGAGESSAAAPTPAEPAGVRVGARAGGVGLGSGGGGLLARAGLLSRGTFVPSETLSPAPPAGARRRNDEAAIAAWREYDATVRAKHRVALGARGATRGLKKPALARARELRARAEREEQTRQHAVSELLLELSSGLGSGDSAAAYADLCGRLVRNNLPHAGPLSPSKAMGKTLSEYLSAVDHHGRMTARCTVPAGG